MVFKPEFFNHTTKFGFKTQSIEQQALYRCIYIDPKSGYLRLAQRNKITFYREAQYGGENPSEAQKNYTDYKEKYIEAEEKEVVDTLIEITKQIEEILQNSTKEILEVIGFIMYRLRKIPRLADFVEHEGYKFEVVDIDNYKIDQVLVTKLNHDLTDREWI